MLLLGYFYVLNISKMRHPVAALSKYFYDSRRRARQKVDVFSIVRLPATLISTPARGSNSMHLGRVPEVQSEH